MSSSSATATASRSPSPVTPATPDSSDNIDAVAIPDSVDLSSWYNTLTSSKPAPETAGFWEPSTEQVVSKEEDFSILSLDELIQDYAYEDSSPSALASTTSSSEPPLKDMTSNTSAVATRVKPETTVPPRPPLPQTKPIPPPASQPRKRPSSAASQTVVYPPKESCTNLPIMIPSIPENGTKSRVETQVRVTVDLAHASSSTGEPFKYDRVGSWKWLKLPQGTATKKRTRKEGKIDPDPQDMLFLNAEVTCASSPQMRAKRVARKLALRVRPQRSNSETPESGTGAGAAEGTFNIVQFNCPDVLDFSSGTIALPLRITCYCRHHREKVGFLVHFTMADHTGRIVGSGTTRPIMITDDHKSTGANRQLSSAGLNAAPDIDWAKVASQADRTEKAASGKRKHASAPDNSDQRKKRAKGSMTTRVTDANVTPQDSSGSLSPSTFTSSLPTRTTTPSFANSGPPSQFSGTSPSTPPSSDNFIVQHAESFLLSPSTTINSTGDHDMSTTFDQGMMMGRPLHSLAEFGLPFIQRAASPSTFLPTAPPSPASVPSSQIPNMPSAVSLQQLPFMFMNADPPPPMPSLPIPKIHRLIPASGPTYGGIEVTVLGSNFHLGIQLDCIFGDVVASSTQRWSENTLVCILPPRVASGVVAVWFNGIQKDDDGTLPCLFTYTDESDRTLMELALQVVGLKMTGKLEDAKSVAMRIVGPTGGDSQGGGDAGQGSSNMLSYDLGPILARANSSGSLEKKTLELLFLLDLSLETSSTVSCSDALSHQTHSGQTLLHVATFLKFSCIVRFLAQHGIDLDARDRNGYTALHVAAFVGDRDCARILIGAGADTEIVDGKGKTAEEIASFDFESLEPFDQDYSDASDGEFDEEESRWGDAEESEDEPVVRNQMVRRARIRRRSMEVSVSSTSEDECAQDPSIGKDMRKEEPLPVGGVDEKQAATFMNALQRTLAMMQPTQGIIPNMPHLPIPHLPNLPGIGMPWGALPQIPMAFPVDVPWPAFLVEKRNGTVLHHEQPRGARRTLWTPQEFRAFWEKWMIQGPPARDDDEPPPQYTPRASETASPSPASAPVEEEEEEEEPVAGPSTAAVAPAASERQASRRPNYNADPLPDQEVNAYAYRPIQKPARQMPQKEDRMLVLFWIPILFLALLWAFIHGIRIAFHSVRTMTPLRALLRL
ncbi:hypothetical protein EVG20_g4731 [Dentipellis fragilis]|uniref:IPT/TIG domain-containing protein n=1 Tax=Dentipellis fragilis TaxID=205917 RepID=A0A4Y9YXC8_9AGAM|nr:hypothetical protein EVG20_g4731 [Dentipellis fragilis]